MAVRHVVLFSLAALALLGPARRPAPAPTQAHELPDAAPTYSPDVPAAAPADAPKTGPATANATGEMFPAVTIAPVLPEASSPGVLSHWQGRLRTPLLARAPGPEEDLHLPLRFQFPLSGSRRVTLHIARHDETGPDSGVFSGEAEELPGSVVILSYVGLAQAGVIHAPDEQRAFVINGDETGAIRVSVHDLSQAPGCTSPLHPPVGTPDLAAKPRPGPGFAASSP